MADFLWDTPGSADTLVAGASLNALADGSGVIGSEIDNTSARKTLMDIWLKVDTNITSVGTDSRVDLYLIPAPDGTNYPDPPGATPADITPNYYVGSISSVKRDGSVTNFTSGVLRGVQIPPWKFKIAMFNELGAALPSNANTLLYGYRYNVADA
jgi:hypothetical protein